MVAIVVDRFEGEAPRVHKRLLRPTQAQSALNAKLWDGKLQAWNDHDFVCTPVHELVVVEESQFPALAGVEGIANLSAAVNKLLHFSFQIGTSGATEGMYILLDSIADLEREVELGLDIEVTGAPVTAFSEGFETGQTTSPISGFTLGLESGELPTAKGSPINFASDTADLNKWASNGAKFDWNVVASTDAGTMLMTITGDFTVRVRVRKITHAVDRTSVWVGASQVLPRILEVGTEFLMSWDQSEGTMTVSILAPIRTIYLFRDEQDNEFWFKWFDDVQVVPGAVSGDLTHKTYLTFSDGITQPQLTNSEIALGEEFKCGTLPQRTYNLGVPAPLEKLVPQHGETGIVHDVEVISTENMTITPTGPAEIQVAVIVQPDPGGIIQPVKLKFTGNMLLLIEGNSSGNCVYKLYRYRVEDGGAPGPQKQSFSDAVSGTGTREEPGTIESEHSFNVNDTFTSGETGTWVYTFRMYNEGTFDVWNGMTGPGFFLGATRTGGSGTQPNATKLIIDSGHEFEIADQVLVTEAEGMTELNGTWDVKDVGPDFIVINFLPALDSDNQIVNPYVDDSGTWARISDPESGQQRSYVFTWVSAFGGQDQEGPPSPPSDPIVLAINELGIPQETLVIPFTELPPSNYNVTKLFLYRTVIGEDSATFKFVTERELPILDPDFARTPLNATNGAEFWQLGDWVVLSREGVHTADFTADAADVGVSQAIATQKTTPAVLGDRFDVQMDYQMFGSGTSVASMQMAELDVDGNSLVTRTINVNETSGGHRQASGTFEVLDAATVAVRFRVRCTASAAGHRMAVFSYNAMPVIVDDFDDLDLGETIPSTGWVPPPLDLHGIAMHPCGSLIGVSGKDLCSSEPYQPHAWPIAYRKAMTDVGLGVGGFGTSAAIVTKSEPRAITGTHPDSMTLDKLEGIQGCVAERSIVDMGYAIAYATDDGLMLIGGSTAQIVTNEIFTRREWQQIKPASLLAARYDDRYVAFYDNGTDRRGFILDPREPAATLTRLDFHATAVFTDLRNGRLYLVLDDQTLVRFDGDNGRRLAYSWTSKRFTVKSEINMGFGQVQATRYPVSLTLRAYREPTSTGAEQPIEFVRSIPNARIFGLPGGYASYEFEFEVDGDLSTLMMVHLAETAEEIAER